MHYIINTALTHVELPHWFVDDAKIDTKFIECFVAILHPIVHRHIIERQIEHLKKTQSNTFDKFVF